MAYAGILKRAIAYTLDFIFLTIVVYAVSLVSQYAPVIISFLLIVIFSLMTFFYFSILETIYGQTLGKKILKIRVVDFNGKNPSFLRALLRNLFRLIDFLPVFYMLGIILILATKNKQRLGDLIAKTMVIKA